MGATVRLLLLLLVEAAVAFATLSFELTAARLVAPYAGLSTDTWVAIIAAFLAALALGNIAGGAIAARAGPPAGFARRSGCVCCRRRRDCTRADVAAPLVCGLAFGAAVWNGAAGHLRRVPFMPAGFLLGIATPLLVTAAIVAMERSGRVIGLFYAAGAGGSFVGALTTLWILHDRFGLRITVAALAIGLIVNAALILGIAQPERAPA